MADVEVPVVLGRNSAGDNVFTRGTPHEQILVPLVARNSTENQLLRIENPGYDWLIAMVHVTAGSGANVVTNRLYPWSLIKDDYIDGASGNNQMNDGTATFADSDADADAVLLYTLSVGTFGASDGATAAWNGALDYMNGPLPSRFTWTFSHSTTALLTWGIDAHMGFGRV